MTDTKLTTIQTETEIKTSVERVHCLPNRIHAIGSDPVKFYDDTINKSWRLPTGPSSCRNTRCFKSPQRKKSQGFRSGERGGHSMLK